MTTIWDQAAEPERTTELSEQECWDFLRRCRFGRLAYRLADEVNIVPINAVPDGGRLLYRAAEGSELRGVHMSGWVAFETGEGEEDQATGAAGQGQAQGRGSGAARDRAGAAHPLPW